MIKSFITKTRWLVTIILLTMLGVPQMWGAITNNNNGTYTETSGTGSFSSNTITWSFAGGNITVVQTATGGTNPSSSYTTAGRMYRYNTIEVTASNGFKIEQVAIVCDGSYYGNSIGAGSSISSNTVGGTSNVTSSTNYSNNGTHTFTPKTAGTKTHMYIRNVNSGSTNTQLRWKSGNLKVTYSYTAPTAVAKGTVTSSDFGLSITDALNTNKYDVYFSTGSTAPKDNIASGYSTVNSKTPTISSGVSAGQDYYVWVRSVKTISTDTWKSVWTAMTGNPLTTPSAGTSVSLTKAATSNGSFTLSPASSVTTTSSAQTVTVTCSPNAGYYVSAISATNPATCPSAITYGGSNNSRTVTYPTGANGSSTISVTFSPIWYLKGSFNTWGETNPCTVADGIATATVSLAKNTKYEFQFYDKQNSTWYYNGGNIVEDISGWTFTGGTGSNCKIFTGKAGTYTFKINTSTKAVQVIYQAPSHPDDAYVYFKKWADWSDNYFVHWWDGSGNTVQDYNSAIRVTKTYSTCDNDYVCFPILADYTNFLVKDAASGDGSHKSGDLTSNSNAAKYYDFESWKNFTTYEINFGGNGNTGGEMSSITDLCPGAEQALTSNAFTKTHYSFSCWHADVAVKVGESTISAGGDISNGATIKDIQSDINLTAQWTPVDYSITATLTNVTPNSAFPSSVTYTGSSTTALNRTLSAATGYNLPTSITVTMGGSTLTKDTHYTYNSTNGAFTFTATITGAIVITAAGVAKTYSNTLDREGAGSGSTTVTTTYNSSTLTGYTAPTKTGYIFGGYWSADNGTGTEVIGTNGALKTSVTIDAVAWTDGSGNWVKDGAVTLYAKWTPITYTVAFDKNHASASGTMSNQTSFSYGVGKTLSKCTFTAPTHKYFYGWHRTKAQADAGNREYTDEQSVTDLTTTNGATVTLYAVWKDHTYTNYRTSCATMYNIVLDDGLVATTNNGSAKVADKGTKLTSIVAPTKNGYDVEGYYTTSGLTTKIATDAGALQNGSGSGITVGGNAWTNSSSQWVREAGETFYTKWTAHNYTITYEGLEGASNTNPTSYTIETATIVLANPGARTGYTFSGWTLGGSPITQITVGSTGDKTITANWTLNQHTVAVSATDHVVITATPAGGAAIAESGSNTNVDYNKTITLNCTPDSHWNLTWDVYKTGESSTKVAVTGSGDGATFTMPDYNVTVTAVMTEDAYHTATFKNNGTAIDGYDGVKTYDGTKPSAPTLTDITDACDKTDCNKFYGWIAEDAIWSKTINSVAGKTIYRRAADIPVVSGADVVYHAVWAKGTGDPEIPNTLIAKWDKQSIAASTAIKAKDKDGNTLNSVTLTSNIAMTTDAVYGYANTSISTDPVITIAGLDFSDYDAGVITFFARGSQQAIITVDYSTDNGSSYSTDHFTDGTAKKELGYVVTVPNTTTNVKISYGSNTGNFYFGSVRAYGTQTTSYDFTELTSSNTSGWSGADWDGYYMIVGNSNTKAFRSDIMEGLYGMTTVSPSEGVISTSDLGLMFKAKYNSSTTGYAIRSAATQDYLTDNGGGVSEKYHLLETSATEAISIAYNQITHATGYYVQWATDRFGSYGSSTAPTLYKIMTTFTEFRVTCCDKEITIGTPTKTGSGNVTFESGGDAYAVGDKVETCEGETTITATVTPTNGYQCTALGFSGGSVSVSPAIPEPFVPYTAATAYTLTFDQNTNATLATTVTFTALVDHYIDNMHYNTTQNKSGNYGTAPTLSDESKGEQCTGLHYKFVGWIPESDMNMTTGVPTTTANMVAGGATGKYATGTNYYAIWAEEE